jgi:type IV pilus assembly protein PilX
MNSIPHKSQSGFTLVMSMIILLILTMLGITSMQGTQSELAMAGNMREADNAFQAAEVGLIAAEEFIEASTSKTDYNDSAGLISKNALDPDYFDPDVWKPAQIANGVTLANAYSKPKFILKYLGDRSQNEVAAVNIGAYGTQQPGFTVSLFRTTTRGYGQTDRATRMIQSYYGKEF